MIEMIESRGSRKSVAFITQNVKNKCEHETMKAKVNGKYKTWELSFMRLSSVNMRAFIFLKLRDAMDSAC